MSNDEITIEQANVVRDLRIAADLLESNQVDNPYHIQELAGDASNVLRKVRVVAV